MAVPLALGAALLVVLRFLHARRWFARFPNGVFLGTASTILTVVLICSTVVGAWGYGAARRIMRAEMTGSLTSIATLIQAQIDLEIRHSTLLLQSLTSAVAPALRPGGDLKDLTSRLQAIQQFNVEYLEFDVVDASGRLVASSKELSGRPSPDRIATAFNLDGKMLRVGSAHVAGLQPRGRAHRGACHGRRHSHGGAWNAFRYSVEFPGRRQRDEIQRIRLRRHRRRQR